MSPAAEAEAAVRKIVRRLLRAMRWDDQGGYVGYDGEGGWAFVEVALGFVTPAELNALFEFAGIVPDKIVPKGTCSGCKFSVNGRERGWESPCAGCKRPRMSNFKPKTGRRS